MSWKPASASPPIDAQFQASKVKELIEKTRHYDADERFMATKDLISQLKLVSGPVDSSLQASVRDAILRLLDDKNSDVSTMAVKCLNQLAQRFAQEHISFILDRLVEIVVDPSKGGARDIVSDAMQTLIGAVADDTGSKLAPKLLGGTIKGLTQKQNEKEIDIELACLTIVKSLLARFGGDVAEHHQSLINALTGLLEHPNEAVRKRASVTLGPLVVVLDESLFSSLMSTLIKGIDSSTYPGTYIQSISAVCRSAGVKVGPYLAQIVPKLQNYCSTERSAGGRRRSASARADEEEEDEAQLDLWETSLQALEAITLRCPNKVTPYVPQIVSLATNLATYDPMYNYDEQAMEVEQEAGEGEEDAWGDEDLANGDEGWGDDDETAAAAASASSDNSWKVRRAAVALLSAFIRARSDILKTYYSGICSHLVGRFKERDMAVKEDILLCTRDLLHESVVSAKSAPTTTGSAAVAAAEHEMEDAAPNVPPSLVRTRSSYEALDLKLPEIVHGCERLFAQSGALDTRATRAVFALLSELVRVRHGGLEAYLPTLMPHILRCVEQAKTSGAEADAATDALKLLHSIVVLHKLESLRPFLRDMSRVLCAAVSAAGLESNKVESLGVVAALCKQLRGAGERGVTQELYRVTFAEFLQKDVPNGVKLASLSALPSLLSSLADSDLDPASVSAQVVPVLMERLDNDSTMQPALRAITRISNNSDGIDFSALIARSGEIIHLCRRSTHHLRNDVVRAMESLLRRSAALRRPNGFTEQQIETLLSEVSSLISDSDPHLTHLVLDLCSTALRVGSGAAADIVSRVILPRSLELVLSPRLHGVALQSLIRFFQACVSSPAATQPTSPLGYKHLLASLLGRSKKDLPKEAYAAIAQCVAGTTAVASDEQASETVQRFVGEIVRQRGADMDTAAHIALLVLGEMGRARDLTSQPGLQAACLQAFDSKDELVRSAAAFALGNISVGNLPKQLPTLIELINRSSGAADAAGSNHGYLLFAALKEIIATHSTDAGSMQRFRAYTDALTPLLFRSVEASANEATQAMLAECIGRLIVVDPLKLLTPMESLVLSPKASVRSCIVTSLRFCFSPLLDWQVLYQSVSAFLSPLVRDPDLEVRRQSYLTLNALARTNIDALPRDTLYQSLLPALYADTRVKPELVKEVDYGAFKKIVDDGKPLRRAAYSTLATLLEVTPHRIDLPEFIGAVRQGIVDEADIQTISYGIFIELARAHGGALLEVIEQLPRIIMDQVKKYIAEAKGKEPETALEVLRCIVRALLVFNQIPGVEQCSQYSHFYRQVCATSIMAQLIKEQTA